jgi:hypothetical protein
MMSVDKWDDSKFICKQAQDGVNYETMDMGGPGFNTAVPQVQQASARKTNDEKNECAICYGPGVLISCDDCPTAYHAECLGYTQHLPRGKWKCYFCKVIRHGIPNKVTRLAPNQSPVCDKLAECDKSMGWEAKSQVLFDILEESPCAKAFFDPLQLT